MVTIELHNQSRDRHDIMTNSLHSPYQSPYIHQVTNGY